MSVRHSHRRNGRRTSAAQLREQARILEAFEALNVRPEHRHSIDGRPYRLMLDRETGATVLAPVEGR